MSEETRGRRGVRVAQLVGREEEMRALDAALDRALRFEAPQFVTLVGPLGIGKSRLLDDWLTKVEARDGTRVVRCAAPAPPTDTEPEPLSLVAAFLRSRFAIGEGVPSTDAMAAFRAEVQTVFGDRRVAEVAGLLGRFLGLELPESPLGQALAMRPAQETDLARAVLCRFLEADAQKQPLVIAIDDVHRADDRSLDILGQLAAELGEAPIVVAVAARPELYVRRPEWGRREGSQARVDVPALSSLQMDVFVRAALGADTLAPGLAERASVESGGNPFLLEQLLRVYLQHGILVAETGSTWWFDFERAKTERLDVSPEAAAQARVGDLSPAERDLLARAAAFGPVFWMGGVIALGRLGAEPWDATTVFAPDPSIEEVRRLLGLLEEREYLVRMPSTTMPGDTEWSFFQPEERALVASSIDPELMRRRKRFAAQWLEARITTQPTSERMELCGNLYEEGDDARRAGTSFISAGDEARRRLRFERARSLYLRGMRLLEQDDSVLKLDAYHKLGDVACRLGRSHEALSHFGQMLHVAWRMDLPAKGGAAHARIGRLYRSLGDYRRAHQHLDLAHLLFGLAGDRPGIAATLDDIGRVQFLVGRTEDARRCHRAAYALREELGDERGKALTLSWLGLVETQAGELGRAEQCFQQALAVSRTARDPHGIVLSLLDLGGVEREAGHAERAQSLLEEARKLARDMGERLYECQIGLQIGDCLLERSLPREAEAELRAAKELAQKFGAKQLVAEADRGLAEAHLGLADTLAARDHAHAALALAESIGATPVAGAALRVLATAVARGAPGDPDRGGPREMFDRAVELLGGAGAELELGRTFSAYAEFEERTGREEVAHELRLQAQGIQDRARSGVVRRAPEPTREAAL